MQKFFRLTTILSLLLICGCTANLMGSSAMTMNRFQDITLGMDTKQLVAVAGRPYQVKKTATPGTVKYIYIERFTGAPGQERQMRLYIIEVSGGRVAGKSYELEQQSLSDYILEKNGT